MIMMNKNGSGLGVESKFLCCYTEGNPLELEFKFIIKLVYRGVFQKYILYKRENFLNYFGDKRNPFEKDTYTHLDLMYEKFYMAGYTVDKNCDDCNYRFFCFTDEPISITIDASGKNWILL